MRPRLVFVASLVALSIAGTAFAQHYPFERSFDVTGTAMLDVSTIRGKIDVTIGDAGRIVVSGAATVRVGLVMPPRAMELAKKVASNPPITRDGTTIRLRAPADTEEQRAMTVNYQVRVPPDTEIVSESDSGATSIDGVKGRVSVRTQSGAISLTGLGGGVRVRTQSGALDLSLKGNGDVDVQTGSSAIQVHDARGTLTAVTQSGRMTLDGTPGGAWNATTGSSRIEITFSRTPFTLDATSGSSDVKVTGAELKGSSSKGKAAGTVLGGGPLVRARTQSGVVSIAIAER